MLSSEDGKMFYGEKNKHLGNKTVKFIGHYQLLKHPNASTLWHIFSLRSLLLVFRPVCLFSPWQQRTALTILSSNNKSHTRQEPAVVADTVNSPVRLTLTLSLKRLNNVTTEHMICFLTVKEPLETHTYTRTQWTPPLFHKEMENIARKGGGEERGANCTHVFD